MARKNGFVPPTVEEVKRYCEERGNQINAEQYVSYYTSNGWMVGGKTPMVDWKSSIRCWERYAMQNDANHNIERKCAESTQFYIVSPDDCIDHKEKTINIYELIDSKVGATIKSFLRVLEDELICGLVECESPIEQMMGIALQSLLFLMPAYCRILSVKNQEVIESPRTGKSYRADFVIDVEYWDGIKKYVVECDGHEFHQKTKEQVQNDYCRERDLTLCGYTVLRFTGSEIVSNTAICAREIYEIIEYRAKEHYYNEKG